MIDIHTHMLPGVDDGAECLEISVQMARQAVESGVSDLIVTPHYDIPGTEQVSLDVLRERIRTLREALKAENIPLNLYSGMEIFGTPETAARLRSGALTTLAGSRYPLIEFPFSDYGYQATKILEAVRSTGLVPVVAHPERYVYVQQEPKLLNLWFDIGCLFQINRGSIFGRFGQESFELAEAALSRGFVSFLASDTHGADVRTTWMKDVQEYLLRRCSSEHVKWILEDCPSAVLDNRAIIRKEPDWF